MLLLALAALLVTGCRPAGPATPTPIPADVARPAQSTPVYSTAEPRFHLSTETPNVVFITPTVAPTPADLAALPPAGPSSRELLSALLMDQPPTAMGIVIGGATLLDSPGGLPVTSAPAATTLTVTGRSADGDWLAVFTNKAIAGWVPAASVLLYGDDDLGVVDKAFSPAPVATMLAEAMLPAGTPMATYFAGLTQTPQRPTPLPETPAPPAAPAAGEAAAAAPNASILMGVSSATGNLNLRAEPDMAAAVVASLPAHAEVIALARTPAGDWLRVRTPLGDGWVSAALVTLEGDAAALAVEE